MTEKEANIYLVILELGSAPASTISRRSGVKRPTTYSLLKEMISKNIASWIVRDWVTFFQVIEPEILLGRMKWRYEEFKDIMPSLHQLDSMYDNKPKIKYYEWVQWLKELYSQLLSSECPLYSFLSDDNINSDLQAYLNGDFVSMRKKKEIQANVIVSSSDENIFYINATKNNKYTNIKVTDNDFLKKMQWETVLYGENSVAYFLYSSKEMIWYSISSNQLYNSTKWMFEFIWSQL